LRDEKIGTAVINCTTVIVRAGVLECASGYDELTSARA
jgi:hypothetical protein